MNKVDFDSETEISIDGMRGQVLLAEDCVGDGATLPSPINGLPVRNNKVYWYAIVTQKLQYHNALSQWYFLKYCPSIAKPNSVKNVQIITNS